MQLVTINKLFIKIQAFNCKQLTLTSERIKRICNQLNYKCIGPISLPTKKRIYCILRSPHVNKDAREHFEIRTFTKILKIETVNFINTKFFIPAGVKITIIESKK